MLWCCHAREYSDKTIPVGQWKWVYPRQQYNIQREQTRSPFCACDPGAGTWPFGTSEPGDTDSYLDMIHAIEQIAWPPVGDRRCNLAPATLTPCKALLHFTLGRSSTGAEYGEQLTWDNGRLLVLLFSGQKPEGKTPRGRAQALARALAKDKLLDGVGQAVFARTKGVGPFVFLGVVESSVQLQPRHGVKPPRYRMTVGLLPESGQICGQAGLAGEGRPKWVRGALQWANMDWLRADCQPGIVDLKNSGNRVPTWARR